jgi:hypothetical protein
MRKKTLKRAALAAVAGTLLQFGGCLGGGFLQKVMLEVAAEQVAGFVPSFGGLGDLFDGGAAE